MTLLAGVNVNVNLAHFLIGIDVIRRIRRLAWWDYSDGLNTLNSSMLKP
jgi:hypothetical protein